MNTLIKAHILIIFPLLVSCVRTENASKAFIELLENPQIPKNKINFNGAYTFISEERFSIPVTDANGKTNYVDTFYLNYPIFFFENGMVMNSRVIFVDTTEANLLLPKGSKYKFSYNIWGVYKISNDTITAKLFLLYVGKGLVKYYSETNFRGIIKNKDTIIQWHMVEPYPKKNTSVCKSVSIFEKSE